MEDVTDTDYMHGKKVYRDFKITKISEYHDLYLKSDTLFFGWCFWNVRKMWLKNNSAPVLAWQAALKGTEVKLELLTDIDVLLMVKNRIRAGIHNAIYRYAKTNNKYIEDYGKNKESSYLK